jgi:hypothetical protein
MKFWKFSLSRVLKSFILKINQRRENNIKIALFFDKILAWRYDNEYSDTQHYNTHHYGPNCDTQHQHWLSYAEYSNAVLLWWVS